MEGMIINNNIIYIIYINNILDIIVIYDFIIIIDLLKTFPI